MTVSINPVAPTRHDYLEYNAARNDLARRRPAFLNELRYMRRASPSFPGTRVLDVGCGPGTLTQFLVQEGADAWGLDFDHTLVGTARARVPGRSPDRFLVGRVEQLPYRDEMFDACILDSVLEHVPEWQATLSEAARVLRPGGLLVFYTANRLHPFTREINHFPFYPWLPEAIKKPILRWVMAHRPDMVNYTEFPAVNWFTYEQLRRVLERLGFRVRTRLDLLDTSHLQGWKQHAAALVPIVRRVSLFRYFYYLYARDVSVYAVKNGRP